jgi:hypothetical protein
MPLADTIIRCSNCGPGWLGTALTLAALAVAAGALWIASREHREFMRQARARARFDLDASIANYAEAMDGGVIVHPASSIRPIVRVRIGNYGEKAAATTLMNVVAPRELDTIRWCGPTGQELDSVRPAFVNTEPIGSPDGRRIPSQTLAEEHSRITRKGGFVSFFCFTLALPEDGSELHLPFRISAQADEIPDDVSEYSVSFEIRARRRRS